MKVGTRIWHALRILLGFALVVFFAPGLSLWADQKPDRTADKNSATRAEAPITLEAISRDPEKWAGSAPTAVRWSEDSSKLDFQWNPERVDRSETYELDVRSGDSRPRKVADDEKRWLSFEPSYLRIVRRGIETPLATPFVAVQDGCEKAAGAFKSRELKINLQTYFVANGFSGRCNPGDERS